MAVLLTAAGVGAAAAGLAWLGGLQQPLVLAVVALAAMTATALIGSWILDARPRGTGPICAKHPSGRSAANRTCPPTVPAATSRPGWLQALRGRRRTYSGYLMHLGLACLAVGVAGSSLGTRQHEAALGRGESMRWAERNVRFVRLIEQRLPDRLVVQAELQVTSAGAAPFTVTPAQEYYLLENQWRAKSPSIPPGAATSTRSSTAARARTGIQLTVVENPLMRWLWLSGGIVLAGAVPWFWPRAERRGRRGFRQKGSR